LKNSNIYYTKESQKHLSLCATFIAGNPNESQVSCIVAVVCSCAWGYLTQVQLPIDAWADDSATILRDFCSIVPGPLGRIVEISASPQSTASVAVERGPLTLNVPADSAGCYLRGGDIVKPGRATSVTILQPDGKIVTGDFNDRLVMPVVSDNGLSHAFWSFVHEWAGGDLAEARERARTLIGATRGGDDSPILIRGLFEAGMQRVDRSRPLEVQWQGGSFPFSIELEGPRGTTLPPIRQSVHSERVFALSFTLAQPASTG